MLFCLVDRSTSRYNLCGLVDVGGDLYFYGNTDSLFTDVVYVKFGYQIEN